MSRFLQIAMALSIFQSAFTYAQKPLSKNKKKEVIESIKATIDANYVFLNEAKRINTALDSLNATGKYIEVTDGQAFAEVLTHDLVLISQDKHFKVQYRPDLSGSRKKRTEENNDQGPGEQEEKIDLNLWYAQKANFGFEKVEILEGNIGYIKLTFFEPFQWVKPTMDAAMGFVANTDALILDLRGNGGGYASATYLASYFFDEQPVVWNTSYNRATDETEIEYTHGRIDGERYVNKPLYILVDEKSFSRAEGFAYGMKHFNRATVIGQLTPGAAHGINFLEMDHSFFIQVPVERNIHPVTKKDWEGVGVIPHIRTSKEESFNLAYTHALDTLMGTKSDSALGVHYDRLIQKYKQIKEKLKEPSVE